MKVRLYVVKVFFISLVGMMFLVKLPLYAAAEGEVQETPETEVVLEEETVEDMVLFTAETCPYCAETKAFIEENDLKQYIEYVDVNENPTLYNDMFDTLGVPLEQRGSVPVLFVGDSEYYEAADKIQEYLAGRFGIEGVIDNDDDSGSNNIQVVFIILGLGLIISIVFLYFSFKKSDR